MKNFNSSGIYFLKAQGSEIEIAKQHFELYKSEIQKGALSQLKSKTQKIIGESQRVKSGTLKKLIASGILNLNHKAFLKFTHDENLLIKEMSKRLDLTEFQARCAYTQGESLNFIAGLSFDFKNFGCTSAVVSSSKSSTGNVIHGRNFDYPVVGSWEKLPLLLFVEPESGKRFISHTSLGVHTGSITSMNETGLTLALHFHPTRATIHRGHTVHSTLNKIIQTASTINEAIDIVRKAVPFGSWTIIVGSNKDNDAVAIEVSRGEVQIVHSENGCLSRSNIFTNEKLHSKEISPVPSFYNDAKARLDVMRDNLSSKSTISPQDIHESLGSLYDPYLKLNRATGNVIAAITNVASTIMDTENNCMFINMKKTTPVSIGEMLKVPFEFDFQKLEQNLIDKLPSTTYNTNTIQALDNYAQSFTHYHNENNYEAALEKLIVADDFASKENIDGAFALMTGMLFLKTFNTKSSEKYIDKAISSRNLNTDKICLAKLFKARLLDLRNERESSIKILNELIYNNQTPSYIVKTAKKQKLFKYNLKDAKRIQLDFQYHDCILF